MRQGFVKFRTAMTLAVVLVAGSAAMHAASAQAWVAPKGALDLSLDYNFGKSDKVIGEGALEFPDAGTTTHQFTVGAEFVPLPRLAVTVGLPLAVLKYTGSKTAFPHPGGGRYDDGSAHATLTDLRFGARYQVLEAPFALAPHLGVTIPVADYETIGNTVGGRHLKALHMGLGIGKVIHEAVYVHVIYEFSLVEKYDRTVETKQYGQNRSDLAATVGLFVLDHKLDLHLDANVRETHDGVTFNDYATLRPNEQLYHDAILDEDIVLVGGGVGYAINDQLGVSASARYFLSGDNTQNASVLALGLTWSPLL